MSTKKNKAKKNTSTKNSPEPWGAQLNLPPEITQLYRNKKRTTTQSPLHYVANTRATKRRVPPPSRCSSGEHKYPELRLVGDPSASCGRQDYFYGHYIPHIAALHQQDATDGRRIMVYDGNNRKWTSHEFYAADPFDLRGKYMEFTSVTGLMQRKYCALTLQGALAVIERVDSGLEITGISGNRAVPTGDWRMFREQLFLMNNDVVLILFVHERSIEVVDRVEVFRLCFDGLKWVKIEGMEGKTVFLDRRCCWVNSGEIGCRGDCVYFTQGGCNGWWVYDMQSCCISVAFVKNDE